MSTTEDIVDKHAATLERPTGPGGSIAKDAPTATIHHQGWTSRSGRPSSARLTVRRRVADRLRESTGIPDIEWLVLDADEVKDLLLEEARADGSSLDIVPADVKAIEDAGPNEREDFFPRELAALVHAESSQIAHDLRLAAITAGENIVIDGVLADTDEALRLGALLESAGYTIHVAQIECSESLSRERMHDRWADGYRHALAALPTVELGGRWVPPAYISTLYPGGQTVSGCFDAATQLAHQTDAVLTFHRFDVQDRHQKSRILTEHLTRDTAGAPFTRAHG